jgi:hypothetical protein
VVRALSRLWIVIAIVVSGFCPIRASQANRWIRAHESEEKYWAKKEHSNIGRIHQIIASAGLESADGFSIENLDTHSLLSKNQVLLSVSESGTGHCLTVYVLQESNGDYKKIWSTDQLNEEQNFCAQSMLGAAHAYASSGDIIVQMPVDIKDDLTAADPKIELLCVRFSWDGKTYSVAESDRKVIHRSVYRIKGRLCSP